MRHVPVYQVIAEDLQAMGVDSVFGLMSDDICQLVATLDAIGVRFIGARHETQAVMSPWSGAVRRWPMPCMRRCRPAGPSTRF